MMIKYKNIKVLVYDFDGVMTDNKVYVDENGNEIVQVNRADGLAIALLKKKGFKQLILSTEQNPVVSQRAKKLNIPVIQNCQNKKDALKNYCIENDIELQRVAYVGNDINDKEAMEVVALNFCPADAHESIKTISNHILKVKGGDGVVRELLDFITEKKGE